jgi:hypothetical protein
VLICVSFLLAVFLNHSAAERRGVPNAAMKVVPVNEQRSAAIPVVTSQGGGPECRAFTSSAAEQATTVSIDQHCPAPRQ